MVFSQFFKSHLVGFSAAAEITGTDLKGAEVTQWTQGHPSLLGTVKSQGQKAVASYLFDTMQDISTANFPLDHLGIEMRHVQGSDGKRQKMIQNQV